MSEIKKNPTMSSERNYGLDALRMVSMLMIVILHVLGRGGVLHFSKPFSVNYEVGWFFEIASYVAVNCYALISGFVGYSRKYKYSNLIYLWFEVVFYCLSISVLFKVLLPETTSLKQILTSFIPVSSDKYWYFTAYFCMAFFIPIFNWLIEKLTFRQSSFLIGTLIVVFSVIPLLFFSKVLEGENGDIFVIKGGYSPLWLAILYIFGAYIKKYVFIDRVKKDRLVAIYVLCIIFTWLFKLVTELLNSRFGGETDFSSALIDYSSPTILIGAVSLFLLFAGWKVRKGIRIIRFFAPATFGVYLIHLQTNIWDKFEYRFSFLANYNVLIMLMSVIGISVAIFLICSLIDRIRILFFDLIRIRKLCQRIDECIKKVYDMMISKVLYLHLFIDQ